MEITEDQMEWATVHRMREMLLSVHDDYKVTHTYALFTTILCWVAQRIRSRGVKALDHKALSVYAALSMEDISEPPWNIPTAATCPQESNQSIPMIGPFPEFEGFNAARFMTVLRNATAHGDARSVRPVNRNNILVGHEFDCSERNEHGISWRGIIVLERRDMQRIGIALADRFCSALSRGAENQENGFEATARTICEQAA